MPRFELYPFRYRNRVTAKWIRARYVAERHEIAARYAEWEIIGPPRVRDAGLLVLASGEVLIGGAAVVRERQRFEFPGRRELAPGQVRTDGLGKVRIGRQEPT